MGHPKCTWRSASAQAAAIHSTNDASVSTDLISPDSHWKFHLAEMMDEREPGYLRLMGFPDDWKRQPQWCLG
ncbi:hypothetical protein EMIT0P265_80176 [Pseudomonas zeae]